MANSDMIDLLQDGVASGRMFPPAVVAGCRDCNRFTPAGEGKVMARMIFRDAKKKARDVVAPRRFLPRNGAAYLRSEEHTSELKSLVRISYAVFCLKKKKH